jgi:hypothetical protein
MNGFATYMQVATAELARMSAGTKLTYIGLSTITVEKQADGGWKQVQVESGLKRITSEYLASRYPTSEEAPDESDYHAQAPAL